MTSLADVMANLQDPERTLATARQWASERVSDCHGVRVWLDWANHVFRCHRCNQVCEPVLPDEKETTVPDDTHEEQIDGIEWIAALRALARRMRRAEHARSRVWGDEVDRFATRLRDGQPAEGVEEAADVLLERAEKAEVAARDFAEALAEVIERCPGSSKPDIPGLIARSALACHPEYAPERKETQ